MVHARPLVLGFGLGHGLGGHGDDGRHHQVHRDDIGYPFGHAGELPQQPAGVGDDDRLGHPEAADPSRPGLGQRRFDDRGPDDGHRDGIPELGHQRPLPQRLGVGVGVRPPERLGPGLARSHHLLFDPVLPESLGPLGQEMQPGASEVGRRASLANLASRSDPRDSASKSLRWRRAASTSVRQSTSTVNAVGVEELLLGLALMGPGHVGRRHREEVDRSPASLCRRPVPGPRPPHAATRDGPSRLTSTAESSGESKLTAAAEWMTRSHSDSSCSPSSSRPSPSVATSPATDDHPGATSASKRSPVLLAQPVEAVVLEDLPGGPLLRASNGGRGG